MFIATSFIIRILSWDFLVMKSIIALSSYLKRVKTTVAAVAVAVAMRPAIKEMMEAYDGLGEDYRRDEEWFLEMMILDGCFLLDLMIWHTAAEFCTPYMMVGLWMDTLRLENQLPLAVAVLIEVGGHKVEDTKEFIKFYEPKSTKQLESIRGMGLHHLDIYRRQATLKGYYFYDPYSYACPVIELHQAGIRFIRSESDSLKDVTFSTNGILRLPYVKIDDNTEPLLLNYLVYEQIHNAGNASTSYVFLMQNLINTANDVALLREKGIIRSWVWNNDDIAALFNRLAKAMAFSDGKGEVNVNEKLNRYCHKRWHNWHASFMQTYVTNPWFFLLLMGASMLLILTVLQTWYTILSYHKGS